jgi:hypothetical protein
MEMIFVTCRSLAIANLVFPEAARYVSRPVCLKSNQFGNSGAPLGGERVTSAAPAFAGEVISGYDKGGASPGGSSNPAC